MSKHSRSGHQAQGGLLRGGQVLDVLKDLAVVAQHVAETETNPQPLRVTAVKVVPVLDKLRAEVEWLVTAMEDWATEGPARERQILAAEDAESRLTGLESQAAAAAANIERLTKEGQDLEVGMAPLRAEAGQLNARIAAYREEIARIVGTTT